MDFSARSRRVLGLAAAFAVPLLLGGCLGGGGFSGGEGPVAQTPILPAEQPAAVDGRSTGSIGAGSVKVALILPLTGQGQGAVAATSLRNAAELALSEFQNPDVAVVVKDDRGTAEGARQAAEEALAEGAELIVGPLFAPAVQAAGQVAKQAGRPVIAFSTDATVASRGVYLLSFLAQEEVDRIVAYASAQGRRSFAALVPENTYGSVVEAQFREAAAKRGARVVAMERYAPGQAQGAVQRIAPLITGVNAQADAIFLPDNAEGLPGVAQALSQVGFDPQRVKPLGTGVWNDPRVFRTPALQGGWFAAPDSAGFNAFAGRYRAKFGSDPTRIATLSYDAVSLAAALVRTQGSQRFAEGVLTNPSGFSGADGVFRFRPDGLNDRALAVLEIRNGAAAPVSPAPKALSPSGT
ncbi:MAG TPA: penicillin-binding protein activator [Beijerinckiaceae bacterium]|jgi:ABC-type branched-subunit amino acid transport system substrate-binding protein